MSAQKTNPADVTRKLAYLTKDYMPDAHWTIDGAFRFDRCLMQLVKHFVLNVNVRKISHVSGSPPCLWSLDWFSQRRPLPLAPYTQLLEAYSRPGIGVTLVFDNPFVREEDLQEPYSLTLVQELAKRNSAHIHAVCVASDRLAEFLHARFPALSIHCHLNRLLVEPESTVRDAAFYNRLAQRYNRVCLHPADAVNPDVYGAIAEPRRMDVVINDPCLRNCPVRREHLELLAAYRREPYCPIHGQRRMELMGRAGCLRTDSSCLQQKVVCSLTKAESRALYAAGYRSFIVQSQQFRNAVTMLWDAVYCMFEATPEISNKIALICSSMFSAVEPFPKVLASGLNAFATTDYD